MKYKLFWMAVAIVFVLTGGVAAVRGARINARYPAPEKVMFSEGEPVKKNGCAVTVTDSCLELSADSPEGLAVGEPIGLVKVSLRIENTSGSDSSIHLTDFGLQSDIWYNQMSRYETTALNPGLASAVITLSPGEHEEVILPFMVYWDRGMEDMAKQLAEKEADLDLIITQYPVKQFCRLSY